ncbi:helix-turn-helix domain-containing protein [Streptomyces sp. NPDC058220]|uniref:helix-turn-helix domain-containing protein n=1 Tax=Streptomyces sp. NPDC058220 TaxID=3346387 RepID=UPI0036DFD9C3
MSQDWARLAEVIKRARKGLGLTQVQMAKRAGVGFSTYQRLEGGKGFTDWPPSLDHVERAVGWSRGSARAVLAGGKPTSEVTLASGATDLKAQQLPARIEHALSEGDLVDTDVIELPGGLTLVVIAKSDAPRSAEDEREMGDVVKAWTRAQRKIRGIAAGEV